MVPCCVSLITSGESIVMHIFISVSYSWKTEGHSYDISITVNEHIIQYIIMSDWK